MRFFVSFWGGGGSVFLRVLITGCFYIFCGSVAPSLRALSVRSRQGWQHPRPPGCVPAGRAAPGLTGPQAFVGSVGPKGRVPAAERAPPRSETAAAAERPERQRPPLPTANRDGALTAAGQSELALPAASQSERDAACRQPMRAGRWRPAVPRAGAAVGSPGGLKPSGRNGGAAAAGTAGGRPGLAGHWCRRRPAGPRRAGRERYRLRVPAGREGAGQPAAPARPVPEGCSRVRPGCSGRGSEAPRAAPRAG